MVEEGGKREKGLDVSGRLVSRSGILRIVRTGGAVQIKLFLNVCSAVVDKSLPGVVVRDVVDVVGAVVGADWIAIYTVLTKLVSQSRGEGWSGFSS